jgi:Domain of unknown function (DUF5916)
MFRLILLLSFWAVWVTTAGAQSPNIDMPGVQVRRITDAIRLDGRLDEATWQSADLADDFKPNFPMDTGKTTVPTVVRMAFDDTNLYLAIECTQPRDNYTVQSLKRDFGPGTSDVINIMINPFNDGLNGFIFGVNPLNVQREGLIDNGDNISFDWDNKWSSAVTNLPDRWVVEVAIPFKTLRYKVNEGQNKWTIQFLRVRMDPWEVSSWGPVPRQFGATNIAFGRSLIWSEAPPKQRVGVSVIPYVTARTDGAYQRTPVTLAREDIDVTRGAGIGGDAKIGITPSLNLDLTINPDFSQVEVDRQVTNLSRFELFFPERRQFFLENRDLFATFGFPHTRPFFSRRIGLAYNPVTRSNTTVPILAGARLSGKINDDWRVGLLNMQTRRVNWDENNVLPAANFTVATLQRRVFARSAISGIFVNKQNFLSDLNTTQRGDYQTFNRVAGLEYNLYSKDNRWEGEWYYHRSMSPDARQRGSTFAQFLGYRDRYFNARLGGVHTDSTYTADMGFVPRPGTQNLYPGLGVTFYPDQYGINMISLNLGGDLTFSQKPGKTFRFQPTDQELTASMEVSFANQSGINMGYFHGFTRLFDDTFDPTNLYKPGTEPLPRGDYRYNRIWTEFYTSTTYDIQWDGGASAGQYFNGLSIDISGRVRYRWQPYGLFGLSYNYTSIRLPQPYATAQIWLIGPSMELAVSRSLFFSGFFQYNTQANNFNINARLQWRFAPVSDLFLVYTDNSYAQSVENTQVRFLSPKNKSIVLKAVYWLNV